METLALRRRSRGDSLDIVILQVTCQACKETLNLQIVPGPDGEPSEESLRNADQQVKKHEETCMKGQLSKLLRGESEEAKGPEAPEGGFEDWFDK